MKLLLVLCVVVCGVARAEDFTLKDGTVLKEVTVMGLESDGLKLATESGLARVKYADLSPELQKRFHYDPEAVKLAAVKNAEAAQAAARVEEKNRGHSRLRGRVVNVLKDGILVECVEPSYSGAASRLGSVGGNFRVIASGGSGTRRPEETYGTFFVIDHPNLSTIVDETMIDVDANECGTFRYKAVDGSARTVKKFTVVRVVE